MNMETGKKYKIGDKIENVEELNSIALGIAIKALKLCESKGNSWATKIIERKDVETLEDIKQCIILKLLENNLVINKECFAIVNKMLYNYKNDRIKNIEIVINDDNKSNIDNYSYISYLKEENNIIDNKSIYNKFSIKELNLTQKQLEILNIYSKLGSYGRVADVLGVARSTVQVTIERIRKKAVKLIECVEC